VLDHPAVAWLGARSYGFYMLHTFVMVIAAALLEAVHVPRAGALPHAVFYAVAFALAAGAAGLSYRFVEEPFLRLKERRFGGVRA
jgi:peptidoglycan/LPS O-acetylase OafA/YrhL